jgi:hypothetical protein
VSVMGPGCVKTRLRLGLGLLQHDFPEAQFTSCGYAIPTAGQFNHPVVGRDRFGHSALHCLPGLMTGPELRDGPLSVRFPHRRATAASSQSVVWMFCPGHQSSPLGACLY